MTVMQFIKLHPEWRAEGLRAVCEHCEGLVSPVGYRTAEGPEYFRHKSGETCNAAHAGGGSDEQRARSSKNEGDRRARCAAVAYGRHE